MKRVHNFSAGPAALPQEVLEKAQAELLDYQGTGTSIMEKSHRGKAYSQIDTEAKERLNRILGLENQFHIMFLQGGATAQFLQIPFNFLNEEETADYIDTGVWSQKAIKEARLFGKVHTAYDGKKADYAKVPNHEDLSFSTEAKYVHYTSNNTIYGTQFKAEPETDGVPLICDASSDILSRPINPNKYGLIYAGAQKNLGPSGVTLVMIRKDFLDLIDKPNIPTFLDYRSHSTRIFNTPPTFAVYLVNLVLEWIEGKGGIAHFEKTSAQKAAMLYQEIDADDFYTGMAEKESRSKMNVAFNLPSENLQKMFLAEAEAHDLVALKGHRSTGGIRASIYNACEPESVAALADFMKAFRQKNG